MACVLTPTLRVLGLTETISIELQQDRDAAGEPIQSPIDPTTRITVIGSAQQKPISIKPDAPLNEAFTLMRMEDIAQLPVMPNERDIKGVITWRSMSEMLAKKADQLTALQLIDSSLPDIPTIPIDAPLFQAIDSISKYGFVLVRAKDNTLTETRYCQRYCGTIRTVGLALLDDWGNRASFARAYSW